MKDEIFDAIRSCKKSLFVFDEVDKMPSGVFESIASLLDHHSNVGGVDFRQSIFIFLSNAGGNEIGLALSDIMSKGKYREQTGIQDFEQIAETAAYNVKGGLRSSSMITSSLIDHFLPFLPMERRHVEKCAIAEFRRMAPNQEPTEKEIS